MEEVRASCPGSLSFIFKTYLPKGTHNKNICRMGSIGIGCTVDKKVVAVAKLAKKASIFFNNQPILFPTVMSALSLLTEQPTTVEIESPLPLGFGFGISSASTLATLYACNQLLNLKKKEGELNLLAHTAEIINKTGLGSVATQITGGFLFKTKPGIPVTQVIKFPWVGRKLYAIIIDKWETPRVLNNINRVQKINQAANETLNWIKKQRHYSLEEVINISYHFSKEAQLLTNKEVVYLIDKIREGGGQATLAMLGQVIISCEKPTLGNFQIMELTITNDTVSLLTRGNN